MKKIIFIFAITLISLHSHSEFLSKDISSDAKTQAILTPFNINMPRKDSPELKVKNLKPVLRGVLYRGGSGQINYLRNDQLEALCKAGFSNAVYAYGKGAKIKSTIQCTMHDGRTNSLTYWDINFNEKSQFVKLVSDVIRDRKGPIFEHCWAGNHASGELAATALRQFCDFDSAKTKKYWLDNITNPGKGSDPATRAANFKPLENLKLDTATFSQVCPN